jgi:hypothetical protein
MNFFKGLVLVATGAFAATYSANVQEICRNVGKRASETVNKIKDRIKAEQAPVDDKMKPQD